MMFGPIFNSSIFNTPIIYASIVNDDSEECRFFKCSFFDNERRCVTSFYRYAEKGVYNGAYVAAITACDLNIRYKVPSS